jgi:hypothetical protein
MRGETNVAEAYWYVEFVGGPWDGECGVHEASIRFLRVYSRILGKEHDPFWASSISNEVAGEYHIGDTAFMAIVSRETPAQTDGPALWQIVSDLVPPTHFYWHRHP